MRSTNFNISKYNVFSPEEQLFLAGIFSKQPTIAYNFERYLSASIESRLKMALADLEQIPRAGWVKRNIPTPESIKQHTDSVMKRVFSEAPAGIDSKHAQTMAYIHDIPEVIITDFTPTDMILKPEKVALEILAIKVLYESSPKLDEVQKLLREYNEQKTPESQWVHDVDKLDPLFMALQYEAKYPEQIGLFKEFSDYAGPRLKTEKGKAIFNDLVHNYTNTEKCFGIN